MPLDKNLLREHVDDTNPLSALLKGHLWVESCMNRGISIAAPHASELNTDRVTFALKLNVALAFGAVPLVFGPTLRKLNSVRNSAAHRLEYSMTADEIESLVATMPDPFASVIGANDPPAERLSTYLNALIFSLEVFNTQREYERDHAEVLSLYRAGVIVHKAFGKSDSEADALARKTANPPAPPDIDAVWLPDPE
ncbi:hypothetical protein QE374_000014 [Microbacterium sp. SORGH_AS428]|uniref:hypothetical protein n=1 Tax=Microbacterium sp. SORGH_AS_0428 TaxID=3041788 RepID=UPI00285F70E7|nr:hypothetical protein [Microbacterium sp. SORGH_AS_0428]MDR6198105.1 hypothetical protein [Microbacterium sp. SORGH_AS_0428]